MTDTPHSKADISAAEPAAAGRDRAVLSIDLDAVQDNFRTMQGKASGAETAAVVKADGYGLGLAQVATTLAQAGCQTFFVAQMHEGIALRAILPEAVIYVLNGLPDDDDIEACAPFHTHALRPCLISPQQMANWQNYCRQNEALPACLFVDSGFNRLGLSAEQIADVADTPALFEGWELTLIASHLACADMPEHKMNAAQLEAFRHALAQLPDAPASLANSGGVLLGSAYHFDMVRCGIALYGGSPQATAETALAPVATLRAPLLQTRHLSAGDAVGYGADFAATGEMTIGIVGLGYGDGLGRHFGNQSGRARLMINGHPVPLVGRISMDSLAVDLTDCPQTPKAGDMVEVFGPNNPIDGLAGQGATLSYELLTGLGSRYKRIYRS